MLSHRFHGRAAYTLVEMMVSASVGGFVLGALILGSLTIQRSFYATTQYAIGINNESRLMDYVAQDLRRALRVGMLTSGTALTLKNFDEIAISETNVLTINIPDYYGSNAPNNAQASPFKTSRYRRTLLDSGTGFNLNTNASLNGCVPWAEAIIDGPNPIVRYAPTSAGNGEIQVRYYRGPRSTRDKTVCFFRAEYPAGSNTANFTREIAERVVDSSAVTSLILSGSNNGTRFQIQTKFVPRYRVANSGTAGSEEYVVVTLRNARRD